MIGVSYFSLSLHPSISFVARLSLFLCDGGDPNHPEKKILEDLPPPPIYETGGKRGGGGSLAGDHFQVGKGGGGELLPPLFLSRVAISVVGSTVEIRLYRVNYSKN